MIRNPSEIKINHFDLMTPGTNQRIILLNLINECDYID